MALGIIILIIIALVIGYLVGKWITSREKWGEQKAKLELQFNREISVLKEDFVGKEKEYLEKINEVKLQHQKTVANLDKQYKELIKGFRKDAVTRSKSTLLGKLWEHVAPFLPKFKYNPADMKFIGAPIDYIVFDGMGEKKINKVIFLEIKSAKSKLNAQEKRLKEAIDKKKVKWEEFRIEDVTNLKFEDGKEFDKDIQIKLDKIKEDIEEDIEDIEEDRKGVRRTKVVEDIELFDKLKTWRFNKSKELNLPAFMIFANKTLKEISIKKPSTENELLKIRGFGPVKFEKFGAEILELTKAKLKT